MAVKTKQRPHLSHTQVGEFLLCPRRYHLHRRLGLEPQFRPSWLQFGISVHEAVAVYHQRRLEGKEAGTEDLLAAYRAAWGSCDLPLRLKDGETAEGLEEKAAGMLAVYLAAPANAGEVVAVEEPFRIRLSGKMPAVEGRIDLVERTEDGSIVLTDFKTAASRSEPDVRQLVLYREALLALDGGGRADIAVRYVVLVKTKTPQVVVYEPEVGEGSIRRLTALYEAAWRDIERGASFPVPGWQCEDCPWQEACDQG